MGLADCLHQIVGRGLLDEIAGGAFLDELLDVFVVAIGGEDEHFGVWNLASDLTCRFEAVEQRHGDVDDGDVRLEFDGHLDGLPAILGLGDNLDVLGGFQSTRRPCRTTVWSSASNTSIFFILYLSSDHSPVKFVRGR